MHPIERLRYVARAEGAGPSLLVQEAAGALAGLGANPAALVTACRRLIDRHVAVGPMWWLAARALGAPDPVAEAWQVADDLEADPTGAVLAAQLPAGATVVVVDWPELAGDALRRRGDLRVLVIDTTGEGSGLARRLRASGVEASEVSPAGLGAAVMQADLVLVEAWALGPGGLVGERGSRAAAAVARTANPPVAVWAVAGVGRVLPGRLWEALAGRLEASGTQPWDVGQEVMPIELVDQVVGPDGLGPAADAWHRADCPVPAELLRPMT